jgi:signal transduction histidine kinase
LFVSYGCNLFYRVTDAILNKNNILVVPDLTADFRFVSNPFVAGPPHVKFYAGAPLVSPEGYKLGTICILDTVARPHGLSPEQASTLTDLADMTVKVMVDRRYQMNKKSSEDPSQAIAYTAHDMMAPLKSVHLSLSILKNDSGVKAALGEHQLELLNTAASCSELMIRICKNALEGLCQQDKKSNPTTTATSSSVLTTNGLNKHNMHLTSVKDLVKSLQMIVDPIPKKVPCIVTLDDSVPPVIIGDDLKLFRSAVNLLTNAIDRTTTGTVNLTIRLDEETLLLFECEDTGEDIPVEEYQFLFQPASSAGSTRVGLSSIATLINSLDGEYGFRPRGIDINGNVITDFKGRRRSGSIFWFSIPLYLPETLDQSATGAMPQSGMDANIEPIQVINGLGNNIRPNNPTMQYMNNGDSSIRSRFADSNDFKAIRYDHGVTVSSQDGMGSVCDNAIANFALTQSNVVETNPNMIDELSKLALDLDSSLADFEPFPLDGLMLGNHIRKRRALVIDDSSVVRRSLDQVLSNIGFDVVQANDGDEGLKELQKALYDIVLCDFFMPVMDGVT